MARKQYTLDQAAEALGISPQAVGQWASRPGAPAKQNRAGRWSLTWPDFARWREKELERNTREDARPKDVSQSEAERRYEAARAEKLELEVQRLRGDVVTVDEAAAEVQAAYEQVRSQLVTLPQRWAPALLACKTLAQMTTRLDEAVREAMTALVEAE